MPDPSLGRQDPESALVLAAIRGEHDAMRAVWAKNRRWVAAILLAHMPKWADVEDLLQEVAVAVVRKIGDLREPAALRPWLRTVAINAARAAARGKSRPDHGAGTLVEESTDEGVLARVRPLNRDADTETREEANRLLELAKELPEGYREPLLLKCLRDLSYRQIGEIVGLPESTIETRIARGRRMLRELAQERADAGGVGHPALPRDSAQEP